MGNPFVHVELHTQSLGKSKEFYGSLFDWKLENFPMQDSEEPYVGVAVGEGTGGGMMTQPEPQTPSAWMPYVEVASVDDYTEKAIKLGANLVREKTEVPEMGWFSIISDPSGAVIGLWQNK